VFGVGADDDRVQDADLELRNANETEVQLQRALAELARLRADRASVEHRSRIESLDAAEGDVRSQLEELERASRRFEEVSEAVSARARDEGNVAGQRIRAGIQECLRELYPHRHLDEVDLDIEAGEVLLTDRFLAHSVQPEPYSSTGQLNVLALALFIATALRQRMSKLSFLLLDEPIQNLDDVHFLAFIALAKRIVLSRQMILSTADKNVAEIFKRQMLGLNGGLRYRQYEWQGFDPKKGPDVRAVATSVR
jgi:DNA repair exonuclease SbcCD ATPase subunit